MPTDKEIEKNIAHLGVMTVTCDDNFSSGNITIGLDKCHVEVLGAKEFDVIKVIDAICDKIKRTIRAYPNIVNAKDCSGIEDTKDTTSSYLTLCQDDVVNKVYILRSNIIKTPQKQIRSPDYAI